MRDWARVAVVTLALALGLALTAQAEPMEFPGFRWESPIPFGPVQDFGGDVYFAVFPNTDDTRQVTLELIVIHTSHDSVAAIRDAGAQPRQVALSTFLSRDEKPTEINKALFMGQTEARLVYHSYSPRPNTTHVFQSSLENGSLVTVALRDYGGNAPGTVGNVLQALGTTFITTY